MDSNDLSSKLKQKLGRIAEDDLVMEKSKSNPVYKNHVSHENPFGGVP